MPALAVVASTVCGCALLASSNGFPQALVAGPRETARAATPTVMSIVLASAAPPREVYVDGKHPAASDTNPGTIDLPLKTITKAAAVVQENDGQQRGTTVRIQPGTYRESIALSPSTRAPIVFEAVRTGTAVISGSEVWTGWAADGAVFKHPWPYQWGVAAIPPHWPDVPEIVRRREMIAVNGVLLRQVLSRDAMQPATFYIDERGHRAYLWPAAGTNMATAAVEVATRPTLFTATAGHLTLRGLVFRHAATFLDGDAVVLAAGDLLIEDCQFLWNNWGGLRVTGSAGAVIRRAAANHNGGRGMETYQNTNLLGEDNETSYNNWRGAWGKFYDWAMGGIKNIRLHGATFRRHRALSNDAWGFWLDYDNQDITVRGGAACQNLLAGFDVEASQGPITISDVVACGNRAGGMLVSASAHVTLQNSVLYGNTPHQQLEVNPHQPSRRVDNWETGRVQTVQAQHMTLCGNAIVGLDKTQYVLAVPNWPFFLTTLTSSRGAFWNPQSTTAFWVSNPGAGGTGYDLPGWQRISRQDLNSVWADPRFADPPHGDFGTAAGSPWRRC